MSAININALLKAKEIMDGIGTTKNKSIPFIISNSVPQSLRKRFGCAPNNMLVIDKLPK